MRYDISVVRDKGRSFTLLEVADLFLYLLPRGTAFDRINIGLFDLFAAQNCN